MGKKYIIELEDEPFESPRMEIVYMNDGTWARRLPQLWRVKGFDSLVFDEDGLKRLTPLEEENSSDGEIQIGDEVKIRHSNSTKSRPLVVLKTYVKNGWSKFDAINSDGKYVFGCLVLYYEKTGRSFPDFAKFFKED